MDPLYIVYRRSVIVELLTLFSVLLVFSFWSYKIYYIITYCFSFSSFHIWLLCLWCFCAVLSLYDANNAFIFSISLVIKKSFFHAVYCGTQHFVMFHLFFLQVALNSKTSAAFCQLAVIIQWNIKIKYLTYCYFGLCISIWICTVENMICGWI